MNLTLSQRLPALAVAAMLSLGAIAQEVKWSHQVEICPDTSEAVLMLTATMEPGWHLYDMDVPEDGPQATVISFSGSEGVEPSTGILVSVESVKAEDATYGIVIGYWEDSVTFTQVFNLTEPSGVIKGKVTFMACDERNCMPPQSYTFSCDVARPTTQVDETIYITPEYLKTCCGIGWGEGKK